MPMSTQDRSTPARRAAPRPTGPPPHPGRTESDRDLDRWTGDLRPRRRRGVLRPVSRRAQRDAADPHPRDHRLHRPSGCGKTTVLRAFNRMHDVTPGARVGGKLLYHGVDLYTPDVSATRCGGASAWCSRSRTRSPSRSTTTCPSGRGSTAFRARARRPRREVAARRRAVGRGQDRLKASALGLSGGQQQRLCNRAAPSPSSPTWLLMDEPCSALDPIATRASRS